MPNQVLIDFHRRLAKLESMRQRMEGLYARNAIRLSDLHALYEALFLRGVAGFESFLEELFLEALRGKLPYAKKRCSPRVQFLSRNALEAVMYEGVKYLDWLPFDRTVDRAEVYFTGGRPFSELDDGDRSTIKRITTIRNAIAHSSNHAKREFSNKVIANSSLLLHGEKTPAGFLRSQSAPPTRRFEIYLGELAQIAQKLC